MSVAPSSADLMPSAVYVYYHVPAGREAAVRERVAALFKALGAVQPGLLTRLMHKVAGGPDAPGAPGVASATWMEVYEHPQGVNVAYLKRMQEMALTLLADQTGPRHLELFAPVPLAGDGLV